jgi:hypothetical protein
MADYLVYWRGLWDNHSHWSGPLNDWWTKDRALYNGIAYGDSLWVVSSAGPVKPNEWRLVTRLVVAKQGIRRGVSKYGPYYLRGRPSRGQGFDLAEQPDLAAVLRLLRFDSGKRIRTAGAPIGKLLQKPRRLAPADILLLEDYAASLRAVR